MDLSTLQLEVCGICPGHMSIWPHASFVKHQLWHKLNDSLHEIRQCVKCGAQFKAARVHLRATRCPPCRSGYYKRGRHVGSKHMSSTGKEFSQGIKAV